MPDVAGEPAPNPHATAEQVEAARHDSKLAQVLYHDWEAETYDEKWSISYDKRCIDYARGRFDAIVPDEEQRKLPYDRALELGCGSGFFLLNLIQSGVARRGSVTDLSPGMVKVATRNGQNLGLDVDGRVADAEGIPYDDDTFDLVVGHAVLHHIPDVELSLREVVRVLKPGGRFVFAGEPTTVGNGYARTLANLTWNVTIRAMKLPGLSSWRRPQAELDENSRAAALEWIVDLHTFDPGDLEKMATNAGAVEVQHRHRRVHRRDAGMAGPHLRVDSAARQARLGLGQVRVQQLDDVVAGWTTTSGAASCRRAGSTTSWSPGLSRRRFRPRCRRLSVQPRRERQALRDVDGYGLTDATPGRRHRFGAKAIRRPCAGSGGDGAAAPPGGCQVRRPVGLAVHRRGAATGHRPTGRRASGPAAGRRHCARRDVFDRHGACRTA